MDIQIYVNGYAFYNMLDKYDDSKKINGNHTGLMGYEIVNYFYKK